MLNVFIRITMLVAVGFMLSACAGHTPASVLGGECKLDPDPGFALRGKRLKDARYIGSFQEKHIQVCGWKRPTN